MSASLFALQFAYLYVCVFHLKQMSTKGKDYLEVSVPYCPLRSTLLASSISVVFVALHEDMVTKTGIVDCGGC